ncbi:MAG: TIGR01777 family protein [Deltaproteobacteria bacterium]|nr:MAG: TIGR01777 family protein [Deltaproteobacteria bacterium]
MKVFMTGGSGFVGSYLSRELARQGYEITILTRKETPPKAEDPRIGFLTGDPTREGPWMAAVPEHDWIINLAGASIFARWSDAYKKELHDSRILITRNLVTALEKGDRRQLLCSTSAVGYYGSRGDEELTEESPPGDDFLARLCLDWEAEALKARDLGIRVVITRFGIVLGKGGGALQQMARAFRMFVGGRLGSGSQWFSWMHQEDHARAFLFVKDHPEIVGPVDFTAPNPVRNLELTRALGRVLGRPTFMPAPAFMVRLVLGELGEVFLSGQKVVPRKLLAAGFEFRYPLIDQALEDLLR